MNVPKLISELLDRLERANRGTVHPVVFDASSSTVDKNHPDLVAARAEVIELRDLLRLRDEQIAGLKNGAAGAPPSKALLQKRVRELEAEKHTMAGIISNLRVWQIAAKNLLTKRKVPKRAWPKEAKAAG